jgi:DNA mismatch repair protein MutS
MSVLENEGDIVFLKKLKQGPAAGSYGLHVAKLAGIPETVIKNAIILHDAFARLEKALVPDKIMDTQEAIISKARGKVFSKTQELFSSEDLVITRIRGLDPNRMTPIEALQVLAEIKKLLS